MVRAAQLEQTAMRTRALFGTWSQLTSEAASVCSVAKSCGGLLAPKLWAAGSGPRAYISQQAARAHALLPFMSLSQWPPTNVIVIFPNNYRVWHFDISIIVHYVDEGLRIIYWDMIVTFFIKRMPIFKYLHRYFRILLVLYTSTNRNSCYHSNVLISSNR